jgi:uncharacterized protein
MGSQVLEAVTFGSRDALLDALHRGGNPNDVENGQSALALACIQDRADLVADLIAHGANVGAAESDGTTALHTVAGIGSGELGRILLKAGADPNATTDIGQTALMVAARTGSEALTDLLLKAGANARARDHLGRNALHWAVTDGDFVGVVKLLLAAGINPTERAKNGQSPLDYAVCLNRGGIIAALSD